MDQKRRDVLRAGGGAGLLALLGAAGFAAPNTVMAADWNKTAFDGKSVQEAFKALGAASPAESADIVMKAPDIAENGAVVPVGIESKIQGTESIALVIEKNPSPLAAAFDIPAGTELAVTTRVKMAETSNVYALVKAKGQYYVAKKEIKVTLGGCGG
ncbi:MAG: thiosulfate oxidation carrier protein SoxY [Betaproteobacteria bacterium]|nr:thiosulfate oxidation carrier protein SoxY [Betaproteobacteria bacterium]